MLSNHHGRKKWEERAMDRKIKQEWQKEHGTNIVEGLNMDQRTMEGERWSWSDSMQKVGPETKSE